MHLIQSYCKPLYARECFNMTRSEILQLCKAWRIGDVFIGRSLRLAQMRLLSLFKLILVFVHWTLN